MSKPPGTASIGRASAFMAAGTIVSRVLGFAKAVLLAQVIGQFSMASSAFATANQLPNTLYTIIAGGVISAILVPQIVKAFIRPDGGAAYINKLLTLTLSVLAVATVVAVAATPFLTQIYANQAGPETIQLAIMLAYWCIPQLFFYGLYTVLGEVLNAKKVFGPFTWAPVVNNVIAMIGLAVFAILYAPNAEWTLADWTPDKIAVLGGTTTLGVVGQALVLLLFWRRIGLRFRPDFQWRGMGFRATGKLAGWSFAMICVTTLAGVVQSNVALSVGDGTGFASVAALGNGWLVFMLPHSVITLSLATAYFTRMSEHARENRLEDLKNDVSTVIRQVALLIVLATAYLMVISLPFGSLFTKEGEDEFAMAAIIFVYLIGLVPFCVLFIFQRAFYALGDTRTPFFFTLWQTIAFVLLTLASSALHPSLRAVGVAAAMTASIWLQTVIAGVMLRRRLHGLDLSRIVQTLIIFTIAIIPAMFLGGIVVVLCGSLTDGFAVSGALGAIITMALAALVVIPAYLVGLWMMRTAELGQVIRLVRSRIGR